MPPQMPEDKGKLTRRFIAGILVGCFIALFIVAGIYVFLFANPFTGGFGSSKPSLSFGGDGDTLLDEDVAKKIEALDDVIDTYYYKTDVDETAEIDGMYKGLMDSLGDPYSVYYTEEELEDLLTDTAGVYYGIGAYVSIDEDMNLPRISGVMPGTPAERAELQTDDIISEVDKESTKGMELDDVVSRIKGPEGTTVHLTILRGTKKEQIEVDVERSAVEVPTVTTKMVGENENIGYLQITEFDDITPDQLKE